jgi:putative nucleotidyltransferase with HDIG domain
MAILTETSSGRSVPSLIEAGQFAEKTGEWDDAKKFYSEALERMQAGEEPQHASKVLRWLGRVHFERGEYEQALAIFEKSLITAKANGQRENAAAALNAMAVVAQFKGRLDVASELYSRSAVLAREIGDHQLCAMIEQNLGTLANTRGDLTTALLHYDAALRDFDTIQDERGAAWVLNNMGMLHVDVEEWQSAEMCFGAAERLAVKLEDHATQGKVANNRAELNLKRQDYERAREACDQAFEIFGRLSSHSGLGEVHKFYGVLYRETGKPKVAHLQFQLALELARACENPLLEAETESERARLFMAEHQYRSALISLNRAYSIFAELDARKEILDLRKRLEKMEDAYVQAVSLWADTELAVVASETTHRRGKLVGELATRLARAVGEQNVTAIRVGAFLCDVGNASMPASILEKAAPLSADEREVVRQHTQRGDEVLNDLGFPNEIREIVRHHHEHWDGEGYPDGLAGPDIPLGARIVAITDVFDALTSHRAYREAYSIAEALRIMQEDAGKCFDPELLSQFRGLLSSLGNSETQVSINVVV